MEITAETSQKLRDALSLKFSDYANFESRHAIDKMFNKGDVVSVVGVPEVRGVVKQVVLCDSRSDSVACVSGIPGYSAFTFCAIEHAPDDDGVTRYHTETGEVFAECGTSDEPAGDDDFTARMISVVDAVAIQHESFNRLFVAFVAVTVMALASLAVNVYLVMGAK